MDTIKEETKRRYSEREYNYVDLRALFNIPNDEMILDIYFDKSKNKLIVKTLLDFDDKKGDQ